MSIRTRLSGPERRRALRRRWMAVRRHGLSFETRLALGLSLLATGLALLVVLLPSTMPFVATMVPLLVGSIFLGPRTLPWFVIYVMVLVTVQVSSYEPERITPPIIGATVVQFVMGLIILFTSFQRTHLGVGGARGESMLVDLRDRILTQGGIPVLPSQWHVDSALHSAGGTPFAGDFVVATRVEGTDLLELLVVDVSGKGADAGTRALLLSGAFGALLGASAPQDFLPAANDYLLRQDWDEGFATAVHLSLDLETGGYEIRSAGHPPALHRVSASGQWTVVRSEGPVLGLIPDAEYAAVPGSLEPGETVLLYTDGMVEEPRRDIDLGIERLQHAAERMLPGGAEGMARRLVVALGSPDDDRALLVVQRR